MAAGVRGAAESKRLDATLALVALTRRLLYCSLTLASLEDCAMMTLAVLASLGTLAAAPDTPGDNATYHCVANACVAGPGIPKALCEQACYAPGPPPGAGSLKWLGCSDDYEPAFKGAINMLAESSNFETAVSAKATLGLPSFWGDSCFPGATNCSGSGGPVQGPKGCLKNGGCWKLTPDWQAQVEAEATKLKPLIANGTVVGIAVGDEMVCNGLPFDDFEQLVTKIRAEVGPGVKLWSNECCGTITGVAAPGEWPHIPVELDIISYDCYTVPADKAPHFWNGTEEAVMTRRQYESWYHLLHPHQQVAVLPGLFGWNTSLLPKAQQSQALVDKLRGFLEWARDDPLLVMMTPWHMNDRSSGMGVNMGPGAVNFPAVLSELRTINQLIGGAAAAAW